MSDGTRTEKGIYFLSAVAASPSVRPPRPAKISTRNSSLWGSLNKYLLNPGCPPGLSCVLWGTANAGLGQLATSAGTENALLGDPAQTSLVIWSAEAQDTGRDVRCIKGHNPRRPTHGTVTRGRFSGSGLRVLTSLEPRCVLASAASQRDSTSPTSLVQTRPQPGPRTCQARVAAEVDRWALGSSVLG